jgi:hypothetical protein
MQPTDELTALAARWEDRARQLRPWSPASAATYCLAAEELRQALRQDAA